MKEKLLEPTTESKTESLMRSSESGSSTMQHDGSIYYLRGGFHIRLMSGLNQVNDTNASDIFSARPTQFLVAQFS